MNGVRELNLRQKALILIGVPLFFQITFIVVLLLALTSSERQAQEIAHAKRVLGLVEAVTNDLVRSIKGLGVYTITGDASLVVNVDEDLADASSGMVDLKKALASRKDLSATVAQLGETTDLLIILIRESKRNMDMGNSQLANQYFRQLKGAAESCYGTLNLVTRPFAKEQRKALNAGDTFRDFLRPALAVIFIVNLAIAFWLVVFFNRSTASRLSVLMDNARRLKENSPLNPALVGADELAELDSAFQSAAASIREAEEVKRQFFAMVSHDIRTPITSMSMSLELFEMGVMGELSPTAARRILRDKENCRNLLALINDLLDYEKMAAGQFELEQDIVTVTELFQRANDTVLTLAEMRQISIECLPSDLTVYADSDRIAQVLINLVGNALKFSENGSSITLSARAVDGAPEVEISVTDRGRGIPKDAIGQIFSPFKQVVAKDAKTGTGLGLTICKSIVESHGGTIGVNSEEGKGTTFWFRLPTRAPEAPV